MNLQKTDKEYSDALVQFLLECIEEKILPYNQNVRGLRLYIDPSAASFIQQLYRDGFKYVIKANNSVLDGIRTVGSNLSQRLLFIHRSCQGVLTEMSSYVWDEKMQEKGEDKPIKKHDHSLDALRYGEHSMKVPRKQSTIVGRTRQ
jgi:phage terminase large subunit